MAGNDQGEDKGGGGGKEKKPAADYFPNLTIVTGSNSFSNTALKAHGSMAGITFVPTPAVRNPTSCRTVCTVCKKEFECPRMYMSLSVVCPYCNGTFMASEKASPPNFSCCINQSSCLWQQNSAHNAANNIPFDYGSKSSFCSSALSPSATMPSVPMGFQAARGVQPQRQDALQVGERNRTVGSQQSSYTQLDLFNFPEPNNFNRYINQSSYLCQQNSVHHAVNSVPFDSTPQILEQGRLAVPISTSFLSHRERIINFDRMFPPPSATNFRDYKLAVVDPIYFYQKLKNFILNQGKTFQIPEFEGAPLDMHRIFVEVTSRGGICKISKNGRLREVCAALPQNIGDQHLYDMYFKLLYGLEFSLCGFPYEKPLPPNHPSSSSARAHKMPEMIGGQPSFPYINSALVNKQLIFNDNGNQPQPSLWTNPFESASASSLPLPGTRAVDPPKMKLDISSHQSPAQYLTANSQNFTSAALRSSYPRCVPNEGQVQPLEPQREAQLVSFRQREVPALYSTGIHGSNPGVDSSRNMQSIASSHFGTSAMPIPEPEQRTSESSLTFQEDQEAAGRQEITMTPLLVPAPSSSAEQVSLQREVEAVATEVHADWFSQQEDLKFILAVLDQDTNTMSGSANHPFAPETSSFATQESAQTVGQTTQTLLEAPVYAMQTTDSWPREDPAYSPPLNKRKITPAEWTGTCNLPTTPSADQITLAEQEAMKAYETRAGAKDNSYYFGSRKRKGRKRQSKK